MSENNTKCKKCGHPESEHTFDDDGTCWMCYGDEPCG